MNSIEKIFEKIIDDYGCYDADTIDWPFTTFRTIDEVDVYLHICKEHANYVSNDYDDTLLDWIRQEASEEDLYVYHECLPRDVSHYIFEYLEEYGYYGIESADALENVSLATAYAKQLEDSYIEYWKPDFEKALGKRFDKLKALWRKKKAKETLKKTDVFIMTDEILGYL